MTKAQPGISSIPSGDVVLAPLPPLPHRLWLGPGLIRLADELSRHGLRVRVVRVLRDLQAVPAAIARAGELTVGLERDRQERLTATAALAEQERDFCECLLGSLLAGPELIFGFSVWRTNVDLVCEICRQLRERRPQSRIILGGPEAIMSPAELQLDWVDAVVSGPGEEIVVPLVQSFLDGEPGRAAGLANVWLNPRHGGGGVVRSAPASPPPEREPTGAGLLQRLLPLIEPDPAPRFPVLLNVGCPFRCTFCTQRAVYPDYAQGRVSKCVAEMMAIAEGWSALAPDRPLALELCDACANANPSQLEDLCDEILLRSWPHLPELHGNLILDRRITPQRVDKLVAAGFSDVYYGLESAAPRVRRAMHKPGDISDVWQALRLFKTMGAGALSVKLAAIVGWPDETEPEHHETMAFLEQYCELGLPSPQVNASCLFRWPQMQDPGLLAGATGAAYGLLWHGAGPAGSPALRCRRLMGLMEHFHARLSVVSSISPELLLGWMLPDAPAAFVAAWCERHAPRPAEAEVGAAAESAAREPPRAGGGEAAAALPPEPGELPEPDDVQVADEPTLRRLFRIGSRAGDALEIRFEGQRGFVRIQTPAGASMLELVVAERDDGEECYRRTERFNISLRGTGHSPAQLALADKLIEWACVRERQLGEPAGRAAAAPPLTRRPDEPAPGAGAGNGPPAERRAPAAGRAQPAARAKRPGAERLLLCHQESNSMGFQMTPAATRTLGSFLARRLPEQSLEILVLDLPSDATVEQLLEQVAAAEPDVVGLSCSVWNTQAMLRLCRLVKQRLLGVRVVLGGPHLHYDEEDLARAFQTAKGIDLLVQGEGELALLRYLSTPAGERPVGGVEQGEPLGNLDLIGAPLLGVFPPSRGVDPMMYIEASRGCRYRCAFCANGLPGRRVRCKSPALVRRELCWARDNGVKLVMYGYARFNEPDGRTADRVRLIEEVGIARDVYHVFAIDYFTITEPEVRALSRLNAVIDIGVQTINPVALRTSRRGFDAAKLERTLRFCEKYGLTPALEIMVGLPGDTAEGFLGTLDYVVALGFPIIPAYLVVLPGTDLYRRRKQLGLRYDETTCELIATATMSREELVAVNQKARAAMEQNRPPFEDAVRALHGPAGGAADGRGWAPVAANRAALAAGAVTAAEKGSSSAGSQDRGETP